MLLAPLALAAFCLSMIQGPSKAAPNSQAWYQAEAEQAPIYKWSPLWFRDYPLKRYEEDKMQYKWPIWLQRNGYYTYRKRTNYADWCTQELSSCIPLSTQHPCCSGLKCLILDFQYVCIQPSSDSLYDSPQNVIRVT